ncbi:hypothetical protein ES703_17491 [subsurface metagenome]
MPITSSDYEKGSGEAGALLKEFLRFRPHVAYTLDDLLEVLASNDINLPKEELESLLFSLEYAGRIESKIVDGVPYYRHKRVLGFMPMKKTK